MKTPLRILSLALALGCASTVAQAQGGGMGGGRGGMSAEERKAKMFEGITLTADQKTKIDTIMAQTAKKQAEMMAGMQAGGPPSPEMRTKRQEMQAEQTKAIKGVLTADQQAAFDKNMEGMAPRRPGN
jgi:Spy/CpxP family protein refolding chaperone